MADKKKPPSKLQKNYAKVQKKETRKSMERTVRNDRLRTTGSILSVIFGTILLVLLVVNLYKTALGMPTITFTSTLEWLSTINMPFEVPNMQSIIRSLTITADWGILQGLRDFINILGTALSVLVWLGSNLVYCIIFFATLLIFILG